MEGCAEMEEIRKERLGRKSGKWLALPLAVAVCLQAGCGGTGTGGVPAGESRVEERESAGNFMAETGEGEKGAEEGLENGPEKESENEPEKESENKSEKKAGDSPRVVGRKVPAGNLELTSVSLPFHEQEAGEDTVVSVGSLEIILPVGWEAEERVSGDGVAQYVLKDVHSRCEGGGIEGHKDGYEHDIVITPYRIERMPERNCQLAAEMSGYFPVPLLWGIAGSTGNTKTGEIDGCWLQGENKELCEEEYFLFSENGSGGMELFHIREGGYQITAYGNEIEAFDDFMDGGLVWTNGGTYPVHRILENRKEAYFRLDGNRNDPLFLVAQDGTEKITVYRMGDYGTQVCTQTLDGVFSLDFMGIADLNQDGYEDIVCKNWVLDSADKPDDWEEYDFDGYLWDAQKHMFSYVDGREMLEKYGSFWEEMWEGWEETQNYAGIVPEELTDYVAEYLLKSREELQSAMSALVSDEELSLEEVEMLAEENAEIKREFLRTVSQHSGIGIWLWVDADNDGIGDIFLCQYLGGTLGPVSYYLFRGTEDGHYELTSSHEQLKEEFGFLQWEGKNYLAKTTWDFGKKCVNGISLECYENGRHRGGVWLAVTAKEGENARNITTSYVADEKYRDLASGMEEFAKMYEIGSRTSGGTAEEACGDSGHDRRCDMDNDGILEEYRVSLWQTTNYYTVDSLTFQSEDEKLRGTVYDMIRGEDAAGIPLNLWVDETEYGNVVYILYEEGLYDFHICGYLLTGEGRKLLQVDCLTQTEVTPQKVETLEGYTMKG